MTQTTNNNDNWLTDTTRVAADWITSTATHVRTAFDEVVSNLRSQEYTMRDGMDYYDGRLWYSMTAGWTEEKVKDGKVVQKSRPIVAWLTSGNTIEADPPDGARSNYVVLPAPFRTEAIDAYLRGESASGKRLIEGLTSYLKRFVKFRHESTYSVLAHWAAGTWMYMAFPVYPYLRFTSIKPQCGKTTAMEAVGSVSFGNPDLTANSTSATVFRTVHHEGSVLMVDEFEQATDDNTKGLIEIFNIGYKKGGFVRRCNVEQGNRVEKFHAYCPKMYAGLKAVPETLSSRSIQVMMFRNKGKLEPFSIATDVGLQEEAARFRDALGIWALTNAPECSELANKGRRGLGVPAWVDSRLADIMYPLFAIAEVAGTDKEELVKFCESQTVVRDGADDDKLSYHVVACLKESWPDGEEVARFHLATIVSMLGRKEVYTGTKEVGDILRKMELTVKKDLRIGDKNLSGVEIRKAQMDELVEQFVEL